jgi:tetratricopeptide (TPR) repeat protein
LEHFNYSDALHRGAVFIPIGWEYTRGGYGRPQSMINSELKQCDYCLVMFWDRWGQPTDTSGLYTCGTEEEFYVALECLRDEKSHMREMVVLFKAVDVAKLGDPGPQLQKVQDFRKKLETNKDHLYQTFDELGAFKDLLRVHLSAWLRQFEQPQRSSVGSTSITSAVVNSIAASDSTKLVHSPPVADEELVEQANALADSGNRTDAEAIFARLAVRGGDPETLIAYGKFLEWEGRLGQAAEMYRRAEEVALEKGDEATGATARLNMGNVHYERGELDVAGSLFQSALQSFERLRVPEGIADSFGRLGNVLLARGEFGDAEAMYQKSLETNRQANRPKGIGKAYIGLGSVLLARGEVEDAERMYQRALKVMEDTGNMKGVADASLGIGNILLTRGDVTGAEHAYSKALQIFQEAGQVSGIANAQGNLGNLYAAKGDYSAAEEMQRKALDMYTRLGNSDGMAGAYSNLGNVYCEREDFVIAEQMYGKALSIYESLRSPDGIADTYGNLAAVHMGRGELEVAEDVAQKSIDINRKLGRPEGLAVSLFLMGELYNKRGQVSDAQSAWREALLIFERLGTKDDRVETLHTSLAALQQS